MRLLPLQTAHPPLESLLSGNYTFIRATFVNCSSDYEGGGLYITTDTSYYLTLTSSLFKNCTTTDAWDGGGGGV